MLSESEEVRFWARMIRDEKTGCWNFYTIYGKKVYLYGLFCVYERYISTHRLSFMITRGVILDPSQLVLHECDNPSCCNPFHLKLGTGKSNVEDCIKRGRNFEKNKTHCPRGHEYTEENTGIRKNGDRFCRRCRKLRNARRWL